VIRRFTRSASSSAPSSGELPTIAAITMARDEGPMLRRWVDHYGRELGEQNLVVIDDNTQDGSTDDLPCPVIRIPPITKKPFEPARMGLLSGLAESLLNVYDAVLFADADEFIVADPDKHESIRHLVADRADKEVLGVVALNVVHHASEPPLDPAVPILDQRRYAKFLPLMCKPSIKRVPAAWRWASHGIMAPYAVDPDLFMFHMKYGDRDQLRAISAARNQAWQEDRRADGTSWTLGADESVEVLDRLWDDVDLDAVKTFEVPRKRLPEIIEERRDGSWRAVGKGQVIAMRKRPVMAIPERFRGLV
jgi:Glycosyl transferase family 2